MTHFARMKEKQFAAYISSKNTLELRREMNTIQKRSGYHAATQRGAFQAVQAAL